MVEIEYLELFRHSYGQMASWQAKWLPAIEKRSIGEPQREAAFYAWARYSMSIRTLDRIVDPALLPDVYTICRGCLEFDATMEAAMKDRKYADKYLEFEHAIADYLRLIKRQGDTKKYDELKADFENRFKCDPGDFRNRRSWCDDFGGMVGLLGEQHLNRPQRDVRGFKLLSHFAHGSILAIKSLGNITNPPMALASQMRWAYGYYIESTSKLLDFIWQAPESPDVATCKKEFQEIRIEHGTNPATTTLTESAVDTSGPSNDS